MPSPLQSHSALMNNSRDCLLDKITRAEFARDHICKQCTHCTTYNISKAQYISYWEIVPIPKYAYLEIGAIQNPKDGVVINTYIPLSLLLFYAISCLARPWMGQLSCDVRLNPRCSKYSIQSKHHLLSECLISNKNVIAGLLTIDPRS